MKVTCKQCDKEFNVYPARVLKQGKGKFCSKNCYSQSRFLHDSKKTRSEVCRDYHNRKRFGGNKYKAFERDNYQCRNCGSSDNLEVHHIDGSGYKSVNNYHESNNSLENLMTLCHTCHIKVTNRERGFMVTGLKI